MHFWLRFLHITAMTIWFAGLFFLPRVLIALARAGTTGDSGHLNATGRRLYFGLMTPAAAITITLGIVLLSWGFEGAWLPAKLTLVSLIVLLHVYLGKLLVDSCAGRGTRPVLLYRVLNWIPLLLLLGIAALSAAKPRALPPLGGV
jgi:putative membrane protein